MSRASSRILVVDDNVEMARLLADQLGDAGYQVETASGGKEAIAAARTRAFDVVLTDLRMKDVDGFDVLERVHEQDPAMPVLIMTAFGAIDSAVQAIKRGAYHYLTKPFRLEEVLVFVDRAVADRRLRDAHRALAQESEQRSGHGAMIGDSAPVRELRERIERVAQAQAPVLIRGESGSGKELVARAIHGLGPRRERAFVAVNCTALPEALLESELFGHVRGAFTGATILRRGLFVEADGGSLFLDEIGDMPAPLQAKLLRVLEDGQVRAVGADAARQVDVRLIAATHQDLEARVQAASFRADLFYRLNVVPIAVPPLRAHADDIPMLVEHFLALARRRNASSRVERFGPEALRALAGAGWPGNVRELENVVERLVIVGRDAVVSLEELQENARGVCAPPSPLVMARESPVTLRELESQYIAWVIAREGGNKTRAAEILGIDVSTIHRRERAQ